MSNNFPHPSGVNEDLQPRLILGLATLGLLPTVFASDCIADVVGSGTSTYLWGLVSIIWIAIAGLGNMPKPIQTLTMTGLTCGGVFIVTGAILTAIIEGKVFAYLLPTSLVSVIVGMTIWGALCGGIAYVFRVARMTK
jgi:hypothetical protein